MSDKDHNDSGIEEEAQTLFESERNALDDVVLAPPAPAIQRAVLSILRGEIGLGQRDRCRRRGRARYYAADGPS